MRMKVPSVSVLVFSLAPFLAAEARPQQKQGETERRQQEFSREWALVAQRHPLVASAYLVQRLLLAQLLKDKKLICPIANETGDGFWWVRCTCPEECSQCRRDAEDGLETCERTAQTYEAKLQCIAPVVTTKLLCDLRNDCLQEACQPRVP